MTPTSDSTFAELQQSIDDLRNQLAERTAERDEAMARETAAAEVLQVINSSPGDLAPVFEAMLEKGIRLCEADFAGLWTYDGEHVHPAALHRVPPAYAAFMTQPDQPVRPDNTRARLIRGEPFVHIPDAAGDPADLAANPLRRAFVELGGGRAQLAVPLRKDGALIGILTVYRREARPFTDKQIVLLQNFAAQAVVAMENARLLGELQHRTGDLEESLEYQTATSNVLQVISRSAFDLQPVLQTLVETAARICAADQGVIFRRDDDGYRAAATIGIPPEYNALLLGARRELGRGTLLGRVVLSGRPVHVADLATDPEYASPQAVSMGMARTGLGVPLLREGEPIGVINLVRRRVEPFTERQIELVRNFADQAVIAIENARLITETREALEQQTATAEVLGVINSSPGDLAPVFDALVEKATRLCDSKLGVLSTFADGYVTHRSYFGPPEAVDYFLKRPPTRPGPGTVLDRLLAGKNPVQVLDAATEESYRQGVPARRATVDLAKARSILGIALRKDDKIVGAFSIIRQEVRPFSEKQIALLRNFAAQAVIAMENARLLGELRDRTGDLEESLEYQTATSDVLKVISRSTFDLQPVLQALFETAARLCSADFGGLMTRDGQVYRAAAIIAISPDHEAFVRERTFVPAPRGSIVERTAFECRIVHIPDVAADPEYPSARAAFIRTGTVLGVPLMREGEPIGVIALARQRVEPFTERQIELVRTFADQAVVAMENARLLGELRQRTEEVAELNRGLEARVAEQVEELGRVGRLKRFLAPQLAELIVSQGDERILESHRREIVVVFCDLRGYTAFTETAEPEEVLDFLREYHGALGPLVAQFEGTLDQFSGDGIMVFFNDPVPTPDPAERAVNMAVAMREAAGSLIAAWRERGRDLGFGSGIAQGYATLGQIGFSERSGYTAIGTVCNVAARLCAEAKDGQILLSQRVNVALKGSVVTEQLGALALKGLTQPIIAFNVPLAAPQLALRVIEGGPQNV